MITKYEFILLVTINPPHLQERKKVGVLNIVLNCILLMKV